MQEIEKKHNQTDLSGKNTKVLKINLG